MMPEASDKGSQPYSRAYGYGEMAGATTPHPEPCLVGKGHTQNMSPTQGQADNIERAILHQPFRSPQGDSCMAGYLCLMPTAFLPLKTLHVLSASQ